MPDYSADQVSIEWIKEFALWRNGDAKFTSSDVIVADELIALRLFEPTAVASPIGRSNSYLGHWRNNQYAMGFLEEVNFMQTGRLLYPFIGACTTTRTGKETTVVVCTSGVDMVDGSYFLINCVDGAGATVNNYVWFSKGVAADPAPGGYIEIQVNYVVGDTAAQVAAKLDTAMETTHYTATVADGIVTIVTANNGAVEDASDVDTTLRIAVTVQGVSTHAISPRNSQTPLHHGRHLEIENETDAESERIDTMGMLSITYHCEMSEVQPKATQIASWATAFTKNAGTDDITELSAIVEEPFDWSGITFPVFTYGGETLEADILGWSFDVNNNVFWRGLDSVGRYSIGKMGNFVDISVTLNVVPTGKNTKELIRDTLNASTGQYVGASTDLDLTVKIARNATTDYVQFTHDKMYMTPYDIVVPSRTKWFEGYLITLHQLNKGSNLEIEIKDKYNKSYYEVT